MKIFINPNGSQPPIEQLQHLHLLSPSCPSVTVQAGLNEIPCLNSEAYGLKGSLKNICHFDIHFTHVT